MKAEDAMVFDAGDILFSRLGEADVMAGRADRVEPIEPRAVDHLHEPEASRLEGHRLPKPTVVQPARDEAHRVLGAPAIEAVQRLCRVGTLGELDPVDLRHREPEDLRVPRHERALEDGATELGSVGGQHEVNHATQDGQARSSSARASERT